MKQIILFSFFIFSWVVCAQTQDSTLLSFKEYIAQVKQFHPVIKQANLVLDAGEATLLKARGGFDPKIEVDYNRKKFKSTEYYDKLNATFKIPTWYGIELKGNFEENTGEFLNPESFVPDEGLYSAGVSFSLAQGLLINDRMATLKMAKLFRLQSEADKDILVNTILYEASLVYFNWLQSFNQLSIYESFVEAASRRFNGVKRNVEVGETAAIDSTEANIAYQSRLMDLEQAKLDFVKSGLKLSNYLWLENNIPVELNETMKPESGAAIDIDIVLQINNAALQNNNLVNHPKLVSLNLKLEQLKVDKRLKLNKLLPIVDLQYNFITENSEALNNFNTANYKAGLQVAFPLFLRKERGELNLARTKIKDQEFEVTAQTVKLKNEITEVFTEIESYTAQITLTNSIVTNYETLLAAENRKFSFGESSLFLVNSRESSLIQAKIKQTDLLNKLQKAQARLFRVLVLNVEI